MCWFFWVSSGLRRTSLRKADVAYREDDAADDKDRMETLSRVEVPAREDVPDENMVPEPPELLDRVERCELWEGLS